jgi:hypothetical protein
MVQLSKPRLPGVPILQANCTGPEYSRWRRSVKYALETKGTWTYCNGTSAMPMPEAGPNFMSQDAPNTNSQPSLLEERRAWVRQDREVKLDIFLSLAEEVMLEVFEVGPPLPPSNVNAQELLKELDERFAVFEFEAYHHAFCHFLNLHIDHYPSIEEFNQEFAATLEDLLDHGHQLSNIQACSAYFSKMRCTQNPWVVKKIAEWDTRTEEIKVIDLLKESPPWPVIRPPATKSSQTFQSDAIPDEYLDSSASDSDTLSERSDTSTVSTVSLDSQQIPEHTMPMMNHQDPFPSTVTTPFQEITIQIAPEHIAEFDPQVISEECEKPLAFTIPDRGSSMNRVPGTPTEELKRSPMERPNWLTAKKSLARRPVPPRHDRPLPALPLQVLGTREPDLRARSASPHIFTAMRNVSQTSLTASTPSHAAPTSAAAQSTSLRLETTHPVLRPRTPTTPPNDVHPALRANTAVITPTTAVERSPMHPALRPKSPRAEAYSAIAPSSPPKPVYIDIPSPKLAMPWPYSPDATERRVSPPAPKQETSPSPSASSPQIDVPQFPSPPSSKPNPTSTDDDSHPFLHRTSSSTSELSLPLQGARNSAWNYLYESKGGYLVKPTSAHPSTSLPSLDTADPPGSRLLAALDDTAPLVPSTSLSQDVVLTERLPHRAVVKASSLDLAARRSGEEAISRSSDDSMTRSSEQRKKQKQRRRRGWSVNMNMKLSSVNLANVNLARFSTSRGVKEII